MELTALIFKPKLSPRIWGGSRLKNWGKAVPDGQAIGESWDIYDRPGDSAVVARGPLAGQALNALMKEYGPALLGQKAFERGAAYFPLMVKLIDANDALSVQVHPDDDQAARMVGPDEMGKSEMWVVLEAGPGARMTAGLKPGTTKAAFQEALKGGKLESVLNTFEVKAGDVIDVPAGRVHAIGKGCLVAEVQQNSDTTWRVYDYNRLENGRPRDLHVSQALECTRFDAAMDSLPSLAAPRRVSGTESLLVTGPYFKVSRVDFSGQLLLRPEDASYQLLTCLAGSASCGAIEIRRGETALIPARLDAALESSGPCSLLWSRPLI